MPSRITSSLQRQYLLVEFSGLKTACPPGVFVSLTPGDPTLWAGVIFVRNGPYAPAILRFQISFPADYPSLPPLVTFSTDIFHPLVTPLSTLTYTTDIQDSGTVSATDHERLPPGGFSLRHGFPAWFGRAGKVGANMTPRQSSVTPEKAPREARIVSGSDLATLDGKSGGVNSSARQRSRHLKVSSYEVLDYIRTTFDNADVLDSIPLEAAGNAGAWNAWRTHRLHLGLAVKEKQTDQAQDAAGDDQVNSVEGDISAERDRGLAAEPPLPTPAKVPGAWNWEGVWEVRAKKGIEGSLAEPVLFGNFASSDDLIRFLDMEESKLEAVREEMRKSVEAV